jgi:Ser/Thr protein kinase RdoA (MazF antagonist)
MSPRTAGFDAWEGLDVGSLLDGGHRNEVWEGSIGDRPVAIRRSRRSADSLAWEIDLLRALDGQGFLVPLPIVTTDERWSHEGVVVQQWIDGREPSTVEDWRLVAGELRRLHDIGSDVSQRPDCCTIVELPSVGRSVDAALIDLPPDVRWALVEVFESFHDVPVSLIHGDPGPSNIRITDDRRVGLLDWDESRVDVVWHDLSNLGVQVLTDEDHARAVRLSDAWETANAWIAEPDYARQRLAQLMTR